MVARVNREIFTKASYIPSTDSSDSGGVVMALERARTLEAQGDMREAVQWLRRAADEAEWEGKDERVLVLVRAAADLADMIAAPTASAAPDSVPTLNIRGRRPVQAARPKASAESAVILPAPPSSPPSSQPANMPPMLAALVASIPPFSTRRPSQPPRPEAVSSASTAPPSTPAPSTPPRSDASQLVPASADVAPPAAPPVEAPPLAIEQPPSAAELSTRAANDSTPPIVEKPVTERTLRIGSIRVAVTDSLQEDSFMVQRLNKGQPLPDGAIPALLVLTGEIEGTLEIETHLPVKTKA